MSLNTILATTPLTSTGYHLKATGTTIGNSLIWDNGTNVGIGNTNTSYTLDVSGTGRFTSTLLVGGNASITSTSTDPVGLTITGGDEAFVKFMQGAGALKNWGIISSNLGVNDFGFYQSTSNGGDPFTAGTPKLYINGSGNVGIGTSSPAYTLDVSGNVAATRFWVASGGNETDPMIRVKDDTDTGIFFPAANTMAFSTGATERMRITSGGAIQLATSAFFICGTSGYRFNNSTDAFNNFIALDNGNATLRGTLTQNASDERLKNNIQIIPNAVEKINSLRGVTFEWNHKIYDTDRTNDIGVIAQDVQKVLPNAVALAPFDTNFEDNTSKSGENYLTVHYEKLIPLLIEGIKELSAQTKEQQAQIQNLQEQINILAK